MPKVEETLDRDVQIAITQHRNKFTGSELSWLSRLNLSTFSAADKVAIRSWMDEVLS